MAGNWIFTKHQGEYDYPNTVATTAAVTPAQEIGIFDQQASGSMVGLTYWSLWLISMIMPRVFGKG